MIKINVLSSSQKRSDAVDCRRNVQRITEGLNDLEHVKMLIKECVVH